VVFDADGDGGEGLLSLMGWSQGSERSTLSALADGRHVTLTDGSKGYARHVEQENRKQDHKDYGIASCIIRHPREVVTVTCKNISTVSSPRPSSVSQSTDVKSDDVTEHRANEASHSHLYNHLPDV
jgi:hypothetical protein